MKCGEILFDLMKEDEKFLFNINGKNFYGINNTPNRYSEFINKLIEDTEDYLRLDYIKTITEGFTSSNGDNIDIKVFIKKGKRVFCIKDRKLRQEEFSNRYKGFTGPKKKKIIENKKEERKLIKLILILMIFYPLWLLFNYYKDKLEEWQNILDIFR